MKDCSKYILGPLKDVGINAINIPLVAKEWNHLFGLYQWRDQCRLIRGLRKDSAITTMKVTISTFDAMELMYRLNLIPVRKHGFASATTWKKAEHWIN